ncbi:DUF6484 domain-containing protein [Pseudomonas sp. RIT-PI-AD]|uniref:DUF6484 domain-containing protein n=1 Tax=Pseudomonas sp. RIT-PI-AD TaxID=3035294 RepID=UPI0021D8FF27|nr:DUF6484 domain-containing protein [Pseudomonas sp. RIT-PI-AD]
MKTDGRLEATGTPRDGSELDNLLRRSGNPPRPPERAEGIVIGRLQDLDAQGRARVDIDAFGLHGVAAPSLAMLGREHIGQAIALGFEAADPQRPIILGLMLTSPVAPAEVLGDQAEVRREGGRLIIEAATELELRCGEAVILLSADGHVQLRGGYITSHASASQRIRGGSVQIN